MLRYRGNIHHHHHQDHGILLQRLRPLLDLPALVIADGALDVHVDKVGLKELKHKVTHLIHCDSNDSLIRFADLDVVALEQVQVWFPLSGLLTHQRQDGVVAAGVDHGLTVLDGAQRKVLQLVLKHTHT